MNRFVWISYEWSARPAFDLGVHRGIRHTGEMTTSFAPVRPPIHRQAILGQLPRITRADGSPIRVLLVDDEMTLTDLVKMALSYEGWVVEIAQDGRTAVSMLNQVDPDVVILDIMLPDIDGMEILQRLRDAKNHTPTLFLTARDSVTDRVAGLTAGADDYMTKPFSLEELVARIRVLLRRVNMADAEPAEKLAVGDLTLDNSTRIVTRAGEEVALTTTEFDLLRYFMENPERAIPRDEILDKVWNYGFGGRSSIVDLYVSYLRKKLDHQNSPVIHTVRGVGYSLRSAT